MATPIALTIAGSDSSGGAGIQADLKTFTVLGVYGASVITAITAQNTRGVQGVLTLPPDIIAAQMTSVASDLAVGAIKTGMLADRVTVETVAEGLARFAGVPLVIDPVMVATSGALLLRPAALRVLIDELLPLATLVTPNLDETALLIGKKPRNLEDLRDAARTLHLRHGCAALIKGGHLRSLPQATDVFFDGSTELVLSAPFVRGVATHGTGCTYSAAITGYLALGLALPEAVELAKNHITQSIAQSVRIGRHLTLNPFWDEA